MCAGVVELSEALDSRLGGAADPRSNHVRNILLLFFIDPDESR